MRRTRKLTSCIVGLGSGLLLAGCAPESFERLGEASDALSQGLVGETEPNDLPATATAIGTDTVVRGKIFQPQTDADYFAFQGTAGDKVYATTITSFSPSSTDSTLALMGPDGMTVIEQDNDDGSFGLASTIAGATLTQTGTHYLRVTGPGGAATTNVIHPYDLHLKTQTGTPVPETEPNDLMTGGQPLPASGWVSGSLSAATDTDVYVLSLNAGDTLYAALDLDPLRDNTPWNGALGMGVFANNILLANDASVAAMNSEAFPITVKTTGMYAVGVLAPTGVTTVGDYVLSVAVHPATAPTANCTTYDSTNVPQTIPTTTGQVTSTITIPGNPRVADIDLSLNLNHTLPQDLDITLTAPTGNVVGIATDIGGASGTMLTAWDVTFDDEAAIPPLFTVVNGMHYQPESLHRMDWFDGQNAGGTWTLTLHDDTTANGGTLNSWSVTICEPPPAPTCAGGAPLQAIFTTDFESGAAGFTHSGMQDEWEIGTPATAAGTSTAAFLECNSGTTCWKTDLDNTYNASSSQNLVSAPINLANLVAPVRLQWAMKYQIERAAYDHAWVEVREVGGANPRRVWEWTGATMSFTAGSASTTIQESAGWGVHTADVSAYVGKQIELVFHLDSETSVQMGGLAIDDVSVSACNPCGNGVTDPGEACDDGNTTSGDGCDSNCTMTACGNGIVTMGEACDDGNMTNGDGCDNNCTATACGNGVVTMGEACDDGNMTNGDGCDNNCTATACGNGIVTMGEACDDGNMTNGDGCDNNCTATACGNGVVTMGEACDDGNMTNGDGCDNNCTATACGNGVVTMGEACDDANMTDGDGCDSNCTLTACGNGIVTMGEACDDGNMTNGDGCDNNCTMTACGNGIVTMGEGCDDGNMTNGDGCDNNCTMTACGNGIMTMGEICDDGNMTSGDGCDVNCTTTACGNGVVTTGEGCDDGNATDGDGCDSNCTMTMCGNGIMTTGEACDDGNMTNDDGCDANCTMTACGNGIATTGEACDDGNMVEGDGCDTNCTVSACGNGIQGGAEGCDDGNMTDGDGCDNNCTVSGCGNGVITGTEVCDDGNTASGDGCDSNCTISECGNGVTAGAETCDDGNITDGDGCDSNCTPTGCGNGIVTAPETCDDGNTTAGDGCDANCAVEGTGGSGGGGAGGAAGAGGSAGAGGGTAGAGGSTSSSSSSGTGGSGGKGGGETGGEGGSGGRTEPPVAEGGCTCTTVGNTESTKSSFFALFGLFGMLAAKLRRRK